MIETSPILYAAASVLVGALIVLLVDWERLRARWLRRARARRAPAAPRRRIACEGEGFAVMTDWRMEVSSMQIYANGTAQVWIKKVGA